MQTYEQLKFLKKQIIKEVNYIDQQLLLKEPLTRWAITGTNLRDNGTRQETIDELCAIRKEALLKHKRTLQTMLAPIEKKIVAADKALASA